MSVAQTNSASEIRRLIAFGFNDCIHRGWQTASRPKLPAVFHFDDHSEVPSGFWIDTLSLNARFLMNCNFFVPPFLAMEHCIRWRARGRVRNMLKGNDLA